MVRICFSWCTKAKSNIVFQKMNLLDHLLVGPDKFALLAIFMLLINLFIIKNLINFK